MRTWRTPVAGIGAVLVAAAALLIAAGGCAAASKTAPPSHRTAARSATIAYLRAFASGHRSADAAVEVQVRLIRRALGLPPPSDS